MRTSLLIGFLCLAVFADDPEQRLATERRRFAAELDAFAVWCGKEGLRGFRDRAYEALLAYEPDHKQARRALKYRYDKKTELWQQDARYERPVDTTGVRHEDATGRWQGMIDGYVARVLALCSGLQGSARQRQIDELLAVAPDDHGVRRENGEVRQGERWVLVETPLARDRRRALEDGARKLREDPLPPRPQPLSPDDRKFEIAFPGAWQGIDWRGLGTVPEAEVQATVRVADAAYPLMDLLFGGGRQRPGASLAIYLLAGGKAEATTALRNHPAYTPADRQFALKLDGSWVPGTLAFLTWAGSSVDRTDAVGRQATGLYMRQRFGITGAQGWAYEGVGLYANYLLCGTRLNTSAVRTGYTEDRKALAEQERGVKFSKTDWVKLAHRIFTAPKPPELRLLVAKDVNTLTADDLLVCYAMAAYLIECRPDAAAAFLTAYGKGATIDDALRQHLRMDLAEFEQRLRRWVAER